MIRINRYQGAPTNKIMYLWMVFAESIFSYGGFLFSFRDIPQDLRNRYFQIYWKSIRYSLNVVKKTPHDKLCFVAGVMQPEQLADVKFVNVALRLLINRGQGLNLSFKKEIEGKLNDFMRSNNLTNDLKYKEMRERMLNQNVGKLAEGLEVKSLRTWMEAKSGNGLRLIKFQLSSFSGRSKER